MKKMAAKETALNEALDWVAHQEEEMITLVKKWAEINSGSENVEGVNRMGETMAEAFAPLGAEMSRIPLPPRQVMNAEGEIVEVPVGDALHFGMRPEAPVQIFLGGHLDTVFGADNAFQSVRESEPGVLNGPGVSDLKGGLVIMLTALRALERSEGKERVGWEVLLNPDEEVGSTSSAPLLTECAKRCDVGLVFEPSLPDGSFISARKGSGNYAVVVHGRSAHVGREYEKGRNAILLLAKAIERIDSLRSDEVIVNIGEIEGGGPVNVVPDLAIARFNIRLETDSALEQVTKALADIESELGKEEGLSLKIWRSHFRSPKPFDEKAQALFADIKECCEELNLPCRWQASGGVCDGNVLAAAGLPTIDTLGVRGGKIHTDEEYILLESLVERAKLVTLYLLRQ